MMETAQKLSSAALPLPLGRVGAGYTSSKSSAQLVSPSASATDQFPVGLRVLVVDDDATCLRILEHMLRKCLYHVTTCCQAIAALKLLREKKGCFDVVISDVHMPDMDGFKLLEHVGLEMDLPVIMMSADGRTSAVMRGIKHGACDYLIKPVRLEELKNIWQHVVRKKWNGSSRDLEQSGSVEETDRQKRGGDDIEHASSANEGINKKRKDVKEEDDNDESSSSKKPRVVWSVELHQQFVSAVNQLGIDKAVPKRILELMNVPGLTRENVASHLQKFRLYLKRLSGVANVKLSGADFQASNIPGEDILSVAGTWMSGLRPQHQKHQSVYSESNHRTISVQPSCVVVPRKFVSSKSHNNNVPEGDTGGHSSSCSGQADNMDSGTGQFQNVGFAIDDFDGECVKQQVILDHPENAKVGNVSISFCWKVKKG